MGRSLLMKEMMKERRPMKMQKRCWLMVRGTTLPDSPEIYTNAT
jgi:hypothetical protein